MINSWIFGARCVIIRFIQNSLFRYLLGIFQFLYTCFSCNINSIIVSIYHFFQVIYSHFLIVIDGKGGIGHLVELLFKLVEDFVSEAISICESVGWDFILFIHTMLPLQFDCWNNIRCWSWNFVVWAYLLLSIFHLTRRSISASDILSQSSYFYVLGEGFGIWSLRTRR